MASNSSKWPNPPNITPRSEMPNLPHLEAKESLNPYQNARWKRHLATHRDPNRDKKMNETINRLYPKAEKGTLTDFELSQWSKAQDSWYSIIAADTGLGPGSFLEPSHKLYYKPGVRSTESSSHSNNAVSSAGPSGPSHTSSNFGTRESTGAK